MVVELVAEPLPAVAAGDVGVALPLVDEVAVAVRLVAVFDLDALLPKVERLRDIVERVCTAQIDYYARQKNK